MRKEIIIRAKNRILLRLDIDDDEGEEEEKNNDMHNFCW